MPVMAPIGTLAMSRLSRARSRRVATPPTFRRDRVNASHIQVGTGYRNPSPFDRRSWPHAQEGHTLGPMLGCHDDLRYLQVGLLSYPTAFTDPAIRQRRDSSLSPRARYSETQTLFHLLLVKFLIHDIPFAVTLNDLPRV